MPQLTTDQVKELKNKGLSDTDIKSIADKRGFTLPSDSGVITSFAKGAAKGIVGDITRPVAQGLQGLGQRAIAAVTPATLDQVRANTGFKSLDDSTPEGQAVVNAVKTNNKSEVAGRVAANVASFFIPTAPATEVAGKVLQGAGKTAEGLAINLSSREAPLVQAYKAKYPVAQRILAAIKGEALEGKPITNAETALRNNLFGTESMIGVQAKRAAGKIWSEMIGPGLKNVKEVVDFPSFVNEIRQQIRLTPELSRRSELESALEAFADDYKEVGKIDYEKLQKFKEGWTKFLPNKTWKGKPVADAFGEIQNIASSIARNKIYKAIPEIDAKAAYLDYSNMYNLQELGQKAMTGAKFKGGFGGFVSAAYNTLVTPVATTAGLTLYKTGQGLEFVGGQGAKILGQIFR